MNTLEEFRKTEMFNPDLTWTLSGTRINRDEVNTTIASRIGVRRLGAALVSRSDYSAGD